MKQSERRAPRRRPQFLWLAKAGAASLRLGVSPQPATATVGSSKTRRSVWWGERGASLRLQAKSALLHKGSAEHTQPRSLPSPTLNLTLFFVSSLPLSPSSTTPKQTVQNLIEQCLQLYMSQREAMFTLQAHASVAPGFTALVWGQLEAQNADFFRAYYLRLKLKDQVVLFNHLLEQQVGMLARVAGSSGGGGGGAAAVGGAPLFGAAPAAPGLGTAAAAAAGGGLPPPGPGLHAAAAAAPAAPAGVPGLPRNFSLSDLQFEAG